MMNDVHRRVLHTRLKLCLAENGITFSVVNPDGWIGLTMWFTSRKPMLNKESITLSIVNPDGWKMDSSLSGLHLVIKFIKKK